MPDVTVGATFSAEYPNTHRPAECRLGWPRPSRGAVGGTV